MVAGLHLDPENPSASSWTLGPVSPCAPPWPLEASRLLSAPVGWAPPVPTPEWGPAACVHVQCPPRPLRGADLCAPPLCWRLRQPLTSGLRPPRSPSLAGARLNQTAASPAPPDAPCLLPRGHPARRGGPTPGVTPEAPPPGASTLGTGASVGDPMGTQTHSPRHAPTANPGGAFPAEGVRPSRSLSGLRPLTSPFPSPRGTRHGICDDL